LTAAISAWNSQLRPASRRLFLSLAVVIDLAALLVARQGTKAARLLALVLFGTTLLWLVASQWVRRRREQRPSTQAITTVRRVDRGLAEQLQRALELAARHERDATQPAQHVTPPEQSGPAAPEPRASSNISSELVALHLQRLATKLPRAAVDELARTRAARITFLATLGTVVACVGAWAFSVRLFEGFDVLIARDNRAPLPIQLLDVDSVVVQPPAYLRMSPESLDIDVNTAQPEGSQVIVRGTPRHAGRVLQLWDGRSGVPFLNDGQGGLVAHYVVEQSVNLTIVERLGEVIIPERAKLSIETIPDEPPEVELEGAPKHIALEDAEHIELNYSARDDHGLRELDLVLRSGAREERRVLTRLDGETRRFASAHVLFPHDAFLTTSYGAVDVFIAARDDNNRPGSKWGHSAVLTLDKPSLGRAQVQRYQAFREARDQLVDTLAQWMGDAAQAGAHELASAPPASATVPTTALGELEHRLNADRSVRRALLAFVRAQHQKLLRVTNSRQQRLDTLSEVTLALDVGMEAVAHKDAEHVALQLADVAIEVEAGAKAAQQSEQREQGISRIKAAISTLGTGASELKQLGLLGADLGEIATAGTRRIERAFSASDYDNVQRAASFLAERLRRPSPSFVGGGRAGVESMRRQSRRGSGAKPSEADLHLERVMTELQQLAREHASAIDTVEQIVQASEQGAEKAVPTPGASELAKQHAEALRHSVSDLPALGGEPGSQRAALGLAKEIVRGAAESLERLQFGATYDALNKAEAALLEAEKLEGGMDDRSTANLPRRREQLNLERTWVKEQLDRTRNTALDGMRERLQKAAGRERELSERANRLAQREAKGDAVLPEDVRSDLEQASHWMRQATDVLDSGRARLALEHQRHAQSLLERNEPEPERDNENRGNQDKNVNRDPNSRGNGPGHGSVVPTSDVETREAFRRRVQKGLSQKVPPELSPAIRRYAEGLLK
jgi:hypothetical protein